MIQNLSIPKLQRIAAQIKEVCPRNSLLIGGGAPRDLLNGRPVKDIDVFIGLEGSDEDMAKDWYDICTEVGKLYPQITKRLYNIATPDGLRPKWYHSEDSWIGSNRGGNPILCLCNSKGYSYGAFSLVEFPIGPYCHSLQLVFIDIDPVENVRNHFDFGLSKVWVTPNQLRMDKAYWHDHFGQRITYLNSTEPNEQRRESSIQRLARLRVKYSGWRFERCGVLDEVKAVQEQPK